MIPLNTYFSPINAGGIQTFTETSETPNWYQLDTVVVFIDPLPGITVPDEATGIMVQANTNLKWCNSPAVAAGGSSTVYMELPAGGTMFLPSQEAVRNFCVLLEGAGTSFTVQFYTGQVGPIPLLNVPGTGGITPPPPPGISAVFTQNVVHVMKVRGNDATGTRNRLDLPFATIEAAEAVAQAGDRIYVWPGDYAEGDLGTVDNVTYYLSNANINASEGDGHSNCFAVNGVNIRFAGNGRLTMNGSSGAALAVFGGGTVSGTVSIYGEVDSAALAVAGGAVVVIQGDVDAEDGVAASISSGRAVVTGGVHSDTNIGAYTSGSNADLTVNGDATSGTSWGAQCLEGTMLINGNVESAGAIASAECNNGSIVITGDAINTANGRGVNMNGTGTAEVRGDARSVDSNGAACSGGTLTVYGETYSENSSAWFITGGTCNINGPSIAPNNACIFIPSGTPVIRVKDRVAGIGGAGINLNTDTADLQLYGGCYIEAAAESITAGAATVRSYGATANTAPDGVTIVGTLNVVP